MSSFSFSAVADTVGGRRCKWCGDQVVHGELVALFRARSAVINVVHHWLCLHGVALDTTVDAMRQTRSFGAFAGYLELQEQDNKTFIQRDLTDIWATTVERERTREVDSVDTRKRASWPLVDNLDMQVWKNFVNPQQSETEAESTVDHDNFDFDYSDEDVESTDYTLDNASECNNFPLLPSAMPRSIEPVSHESRFKDVGSKLVPLWAAAELMAALELAKNERRRASQLGQLQSPLSPRMRATMYVPSQNTPQEKSKRSSTIW